jgi:quercetin dioxygenase-like cupin family protein
VSRGERLFSLALERFQRDLWVPTREENMRCIMLTVLLIALGSTSAAAQTQVLKEKTSDIPKVAEHEGRIFAVDMPAGGAGSWHTHPAPVFIYVERGTLTTEGEGESAKEIKAGQAFMDPANKKHLMQNKGTEPVRLIVFQIADPGKPLHEVVK